MYKLDSGEVIMNDKLVSHIKSVVERISFAIMNNRKPVVLLRYYNSFVIDTNMFEKEINDKLGSCFVRMYEFKNDVMYDVCEPVLTWIKELYNQFYSEYTIEEFLDKCDVYPVQKSVFISLLKDGVGKREEEPMINEVVYENKMFYRSLVSILDLISTEHNVAFLFKGIHKGQLSVCKFLQELIREDNCKKLTVIASYNEVMDVPDYIQENWSRMIELADKKGYVAEWDVYQDDKDNDEDAFFVPDDKDMREYCKIFLNLINVLELEQAEHYLDMMSYMRDYNYSIISEKLRIRLNILTAYISLYRGRYKKVIQICEELRKFDEYANSLMLQFQYNKLIVMSKVYSGQRESAYRNVLRINEIAKKIGEEEYEVESHILRCMVELDGCKDFTFRNGIINLAPDFEQKALKYHWNNHLAYIYFFGYIDYNHINKLCSNAGVEAILEYKYFKRGMELADELKNNQLLLDAWQKVLTISTSSDNIDVSNYSVNRSLKIIRQEKREKEEALLYNGAGYYNTLREKYETANHYLRSSLEICIKIEEPVMALETIYNIAINAIDCGQYEVCAKCMNFILKIMKRLRLERVRVANQSKLLGMLALSNIMLGKLYDAKMCQGRMENLLSHILDTDSPCFDMWEDDIFLYYLVSAVIAKREKKYEEALKLFKKTEETKKLMPTNQFYAMVIYEKEYASICKSLDDNGRFEDILDSGISYCEEMGFVKRKQKLLDFKNGIESEESENEGIQEFLSEEVINSLIGIVEKNNYQMTIELKNKSMRFFEKWVGILNTENGSLEDMIDRAMKNVENEYNLDKLVYIEVENDNPVVRYFDKSNPITGVQIKGIVKYFEEYKKSVSVSRFESDYSRYVGLTDLFGRNEVMAIMGIPMFNNGKLKSVLVAVKTKHDNFTQQTENFSRDDQEVFTATFELLLDAINRENIKIMLEKNSVTDILTGLYNRQGLKKVLTECVSRKKQVMTLLYLDLDNFKYCNDNFGHEVGDEVLVLFSNLLRRVSGGDSIICRYGGDEFVIFLPGKEVMDGINVAEAVFREIEDKQGFINEIELAYGSRIEINPEDRITCSVGIASDLCVNNEDIRNLLLKADEALYDVKRTTKNNYKVWS